MAWPACSTIGAAAGRPGGCRRQDAWVAEQVRQGPDRALHGVVRWRRIDLAGAIEAEFGVGLAERTVGSLLRRLGFRRMSVRPRHPGQDSQAQQTHKKTSPIWLPSSSPWPRATSRSNSGGRMRPELANRAP